MTFYTASSPNLSPLLQNTGDNQDEIELIGSGMIQPDAKILKEGGAKEDINGSQLSSLHSPAPYGKIAGTF